MSANGSTMPMVSSGSFDNYNLTLRKVALVLHEQLPGEAWYVDQSQLHR